MHARLVPQVMSNEALVTVGRTDVALKVYPVPKPVILRLLKVATPPDAAIVVVPPNAPGPPVAGVPVVIAMVTSPVKPEATLPNASNAVSTTGLMVLPEEVDCGWLVKARVAAEAGVTVIPTVCVIPTPLTVAEIVFDSAVVDVNVDVDTPLLFVVVGVVKLGFEPVEFRLTVRPWITLPKASLAVTVMRDAVVLPVVHPLLHAVIVVGDADTVDCEADTPAGVIARALLVAWVSVPEDATRVYPEAALSIDRLLNVEMPVLPEVWTLSVPDNVPPAGLVPIVIVIVGLGVPTVFPPASCTTTWMAGDIATPATVLAGGCTTKASLVAGPAERVIVVDVTGVSPPPLKVSV